jgi:hypothetical protein
MHAGPPAGQVSGGRGGRVSASSLALVRRMAWIHKCGAARHARGEDDMQTGFEDITAIEGVCEVEWAPGRAAGPELLIEVPHGATRRADYEALRRRLVGALPPRLEQFFFVKTDIVALECTRHLAEALSAEGLGVLVLRCVVPRTFIDCNRVVAGAPGAMIDGLTPAVAGYIHDPADRALLERLHREYHARVERAYVRVCGAGGLALQLHSYAPRSVQVERVDADIVEALRAAYEPEVYAKWPLRPAIDLITAGPEGEVLAPAPLIAALRERYKRIAIDVQENATYSLHPATMGYHYARTYAGQVLCMEINRGLLADPFMAFEASPIGADKVQHIGAPLAAALREALAKRVTDAARS